MVAAILRRYGAAGPCTLLDAPCGSGRLTPWLERLGCVTTGADVSRSMLERARGACDRRLVQATAAHLPFAGGSFDHVVCCRLLHHLHEPEARLAVVRELVRVSRGLVIASFWDSASLPQWRLRMGLKSQGPGDRRAVPRDHVAGLFRQAGARVLGFRFSFRLVSQQVFAVARKLP
jgi:ubiquinone/menaquinone biosynthesis C-methylase UbiE